MTAKLHIREMLDAQPRGHISFHTPGHKRAGDDITELSYSDCLLSPSGVLREAEGDIAEILGADRSFLLTDGSTSGVFAMLYAARLCGAKTIAAPVFSHPCVLRACKALSLELVPIPQKVRYGIPQQPSEGDLEGALRVADALLLTSPDYYGFFPPLAGAKELCRREGKLLLIDGAHGGHLHFEPALYAGSYADLWVDGVHKSLPAMTQGAVVSSKREELTSVLREGVLCFRTTSPSYPIMASIEYAVKYPRNAAIERASEAFKRRHGCLLNGDWTKILVPFGGECDVAQRALEGAGVYPEFNDGNYLMFYLSPCTAEGELETLARLLTALARGEVGEGAPAGAIPMYSEDL